MPSAACSAEQTEARAEPPASRDAPGTPISIDEILTGADEMTTLRCLGKRVMKTTGNLAADAKHVRSLLAGEPELQERVLLLVNASPPGVTHRTENLGDAVARLGPAHIQGLATAMILSDLISRHVDVGMLSPSTLWRHMIWVAVCSRILARRSELPHADSAFTAGLLHDVGLLLEARHAFHDFASVMQALAEGQPLVEVEREHVGFDHCELGYRVAKACEFPPPLEAAARFHHSSQDCQGQDRPIVQCVEAANVICTLAGASSVGMSIVTLPREAMSALSLGKGDIRRLVSEVKHEASCYEDVLNQPARSVTCGENGSQSPVN